MVAVEMEHGGDGIAVGQGQHDDPAGLGAEGGLGGCREAGGRYPVSLRPAKRQIDTQRILEIKLRRQPIGRQRRRGRQRGRADRRIAGDHQSADRAGFLAIVQQNGRGGACRRRHIDEDVGPAARRQQQRAVAGDKGLGRLAVDGHDPDLKALQFDRNNSPLAAIDEAEPQPLVEAEGEVRRDGGR